MIKNSYGEFYFDVILKAKHAGQPQGQLGEQSDQQQGYDHGEEKGNQRFHHLLYGGPGDTYPHE